MTTNGTNYTWTCAGPNGGSSASCTAPKTVSRSCSFSLSAGSKGGTNYYTTDQINVTIVGENVPTRSVQYSVNGSAFVGAMSTGTNQLLVPAGELPVGSYTVSFRLNTDPTVSCGSVTATVVAPPGVGAAPGEYKQIETVRASVGGVRGQTGTWWCENHFGVNLGGTWVCLDNNCASDAVLGQQIKCGKR